jgi:hypothetical protein
MRNEKGMGFFEFLFWVAVAAGIAWLVRDLVSNPDNLKPRPQEHHAYEDKP